MINLRGLGCACDSKRVSLGDFDDEGNYIPDSTAPWINPSSNYGVDFGGNAITGTGSSVASNVSTGSSALEAALASGFNNITKLLGTRFGVPQLNAGESITTTPLGSQITQQPAGVPVSGASLGLTTSGIGSALPIILFAVGGFLLLKSLNK